MIASPVLREGSSSDKLNEESGIEDLIIPWSSVVDNLSATNVPHCDKMESSNSDGR